MIYGWRFVSGRKLAAEVKRSLPLIDASGRDGSNNFMNSIDSLQVTGTQSEGSRSEAKIKVLAVVVIYRIKPSESSSLRTLLNATDRIQQTTIDLSILIWDNTPGGQAIDHLPDGVRYDAAPDNPGLATAYNRALEIATSEGYEWLLTLDQDTGLPPHFLRRIADSIRSLPASPTIGAIVPHVTGDGRTLSPYRHVWGAYPRWFRYGYNGIPDAAVYALNSAATLRVSALREIGGYDPLFPLDASDLNLFHRLHASGQRVFVIGDLVVSHDFSLLDKSRRMSIERYKSLLRYECAFWDIYMGRLARLERMIRLVGRACKELMSSEEREFRKVTIAELMRRLLTPRAKRIGQWQKWSAGTSTPIING
jgi:GT2 family glycosyltransferase